MLPLLAVFLASARADCDEVAVSMTSSYDAALLTFSDDCSASLARLRSGDLKIETGTMPGSGLCQRISTGEGPAAWQLYFLQSQEYDGLTCTLPSGETSPPLRIENGTPADVAWLQVQVVPSVWFQPEVYRPEVGIDLKAINPAFCKGARPCSW